MTFLSPFHVTPKKANMILQKFRDQSVEIIRKQPYILCSVKGFGFLTVDAIARQPEADGKITKALLLGCALAEATAIYGFVIGLLIILFLK